MEWFENDLDRELVSRPSRDILGRRLVGLPFGVYGAVLAHSVNPFFRAASFAIAGLMTCVAIQMVVASTRLTPDFPAFAGEDDFNLRLQYFLLIVCPGFAVLGAWIGNAYGRNRRAGGYMWLGVLAGSAVTFLVARLLAPMIRALSTQAAANRGVLILFLSWILLSALGAVSGRLLTKRATHEQRSRSPEKRQR